MANHWQSNANWATAALAAVALFCILYPISPAWATTSNVLPADSLVAADAHFSVRLSHFHLLPDTERQYEMESALVKLSSLPTGQMSPKTVNTVGTIWALAPLENRSQRQDWALSVPMTVPHRVEAWWIPQGGAPQPLAINQGEYQGAMSFLYNARLTLATQARGQLLLRLQAGWMAPPKFYIETPASAREQIRFHSISVFICIGAGSAMVLYCLLLTVALRNWIYLTYCIMATAQILLLARASGIGQGWLLHDVAYIKVMLNMMVSCGLLFAILLLRSAHPPRWAMMLAGSALSLNVLCLISWMMPSSVTAPIERLGLFSNYALLALFIAVPSLVLALTCVRHSVPARLLLVGWSLLILTHQAGYQGFLPLVPELKVSSIWLGYGGILEMLVLALAVGASVRETRERKESALIAQLYAEQTAEQRAEFVATVSHELSTPLHVVLGTIDQLDNTELPEATKEAVTHLKYAGEALHSLTDNLLGYSASHAEVAQQAREFSPTKMVEAVAGLFAARAQSHHLTMKLKVPDSDVQVTGAAAALRRVLINLVSNAVKYTRNGELSISVALLENSDGLELQYEVADTGTGMATETLQKLNQPAPSGRELEALYSSDPSSGLGLRITQLLIEEMQGRIHFMNRTEGGLRVSFSVPVTAIEPDISGDTTAAIERLSGMTVLVVDDLSSNLAITCGYLHHMGCQTRTAINAANAREILIGPVPVDLLITDQRMDGETGLELVTWLRQQVGDLRETPAVLATAYINETLQAQARAQSCNLISKPFDMQSLREAMEGGGNAASKPVTQAASQSRIDAFSEPLTALVNDVGTEAARTALALYEPQTRADMLALTSSLESGASNAESAEWRAQAHRIASASGTLRLLAVRDLALMVEHADVNEARPKVAILKQQLLAVYAAVDQVFSATDTSPPKIS